MAKLSALIDDFQDNSINGTLWPTVTGTVAETGGRLQLAPTTSVSTVKSATVYDLTDSQITYYIPVVTSNGSTGTLQCGVAVGPDANNFVMMRKVGNELVCGKSVAGVQTNSSVTTYSSVNHLFWRIRCDASNIYWETSATGSGSFFIQQTENISSLGFALTTVFSEFRTRYTGVEAFPGTFQIEAVNPGLPLTFSGASTSTGSLSLQKVSPLSLTGSALSTSTGSLTFTLVAASNLYLTFSGLSTSTGHLTVNVLAGGSLAFSGLSTSTGSLALSIPVPPAILPGGTWHFEPPIAYDLPPTLPNPTPRYINAHAKWKGGQRRGRTVLKTGFAYTIVDTPTVDQIAAADIAYQGGHIYTITAEEAFNLQAAGFTVYHDTDLLTTESGDLITTESGDIIEVEYSFGTS